MEADDQIKELTREQLIDIAQWAYHLYVSIDWDFTGKQNLDKFLASGLQHAFERYNVDLPDESKVW